MYFFFQLRAYWKRLNSNINDKGLHTSGTDFVWQLLRKLQLYLELLYDKSRCLSRPNLYLQSQLWLRLLSGEPYSGWTCAIGDTVRLETSPTRKLWRRGFLQLSIQLGYLLSSFLSGDVTAFIIPFSHSDPRKDPGFSTQTILVQSEILPLLHCTHPRLLLSQPGIFPGI